MIAGLYPTGSTFKPITAMASLQGDLITPTTPFVDSGCITVGRNHQKFCNAGKAVNGTLTGVADALREAGVGATVDIARLPRSEILAAQVEALQRDCLLAGGDDYELLFTAASERHADVLAAARQAGVPVSRIGRIEREAGLRLLDAAGGAIGDAPRAFEHFS